jgi:uncharacterized membrane protein
MVSLPKWVCHQREDRSFFLWGRKLPLCARCTGFYSSLIVGFLLFHFLDLHLHPFLLLLLLLLFMTPMGIDGLTQLAGWRESTNPLRFMTGFLCGFWCGGCLCFIIGKFFP